MTMRWCRDSGAHFNKLHINNAHLWVYTITAQTRPKRQKCSSRHQKEMRFQLQQAKVKNLKAVTNGALYTSRENSWYGREMHIMLHGAHLLLMKSFREIPFQNTFWSLWRVYVLYTIFNFSMPWGGEANFWSFTTCGATGEGDCMYFFSMRRN